MPAATFHDTHKLYINQLQESFNKSEAISCRPAIQAVDASYVANLFNYVSIIPSFDMATCAVIPLWIYFVTK